MRKLILAAARNVTHAAARNVILALALSAARTASAARKLSNQTRNIVKNRAGHDGLPYFFAIFESGRSNVTFCLWLAVK